jgi:hypothetical protein
MGDAVMIPIEQRWKDDQRRRAVAAGRAQDPVS